MNKPWETHEADVAKMFGLRRTITSGNKFWDQGDAQGDRHDEFPIYLDCKYTDKASASFRFKDLNDWQQQAAMIGRRLVIALRFGGVNHGERDYALISLSDLKELIDRANQH